MLCNGYGYVIVGYLVTTIAFRLPALILLGAIT